MSVISTWKFMELVSFNSLICDLVRSLSSRSSSLNLWAYGCFHYCGRLSLISPFKVDYVGCIDYLVSFVYGFLCFR